MLRLASQNKESFDFLEHYKLNSSIFKANFLLILQNIGTFNIFLAFVNIFVVEEVWGTFLREELSSQSPSSKIPEKSSQTIFNKTVQAPEIEEYLKNDTVKHKKQDTLNETSSKHIKSIPQKNSNFKDNNGFMTNKNEVKSMEHSKSKEKIIQQAFFSNINNSYGSLTAQKNSGTRNTSSGCIKSPNTDKISNNIGVSYNVNSIRSPKINNFVPPNQNQKVTNSKV